MKAKYNGVCKVCQENIAVGQEIVKHRDGIHAIEWVHEPCASADAIIAQANALYSAIVKVVPNSNRFKRRATDDLNHIKETPSFMLLARMRRLLEDAKDFAERHSEDEPG